MVSFGAPEVTQEVIRRVQEDGKIAVRRKPVAGKDCDAKLACLLGRQRKWMGNRSLQSLFASLVTCRKI